MSDSEEPRIDYKAKYEQAQHLYDEMSLRLRAIRRTCHNAMEMHDMGGLFRSDPKITYRRILRQTQGNEFPREPCNIKPNTP